MIKVLQGDLFTSDCQTIVNTVNCVGLMGKGIALEFKERYPDMFRDYQERCKSGRVELGRPYLFKRLLPPWILNFPTKGHWRSVSDLSDIVKGLEYFAAHYQAWGIESVAFPPLGCGQGQLEWRVVGPTMYRLLSRLSIPVELYAPHGTPDKELLPGFLDIASPNSGTTELQVSGVHIKPEWVVVVAILDRVLSAPYHWPVGRTVFQKMCYIAGCQGLDTGLTFEKGSYGPFSQGVKPMISRLLNNGLIEEYEVGRMLAVRPGRTFSDASRTYPDLLRACEPLIQRTADLFSRVDTQHAELLATVIFCAREAASDQGAAVSEASIQKCVMSWKIRRRPPISEEEVGLAIRNMVALGWLDATASPDLRIPEDEFILV